MNAAALTPLRWTLAVFVAALVVSIVAVRASQTYERTLTERTAQLADSYQRARAELVKLREQEDQFFGYSKSFAALSRKGLIGGERRLEWIETLTKLRERHRLFDLDYDVEAQRALPWPGGASHESVAARVSAVEIGARALHEGDLFGFLDDLVREVPAALRQKRCDVVRVAGAPSDGAQPRLAARCSYDWLTLQVSR